MKRKFVIADQNAVSAEGHFQTYTDALARAAHDLGCDVTALWNKRFPIEAFQAPYRMALTFSFTEGEAAARNLLPYDDGHFGYELEKALARLELGAGDLVVIHTCHFVELVEALDYLTLTPPARNLPTFHIVIRYDPDVFQYRMSRLTRRLAALARSPVLAGKVRFHSDTQQLAASFSELFDAPVGVCPIPVDLGRLLPAVEKIGAVAARGRPLVATYLGAARSEKGYCDILDAIAFLEKAYVSTNRLHFTLQCSERSIKSEPGLAAYQKKLEGFIRAHNLQDKVRLIKKVVDQEGYCDLIARSDIVLISYCPTSYRYRSSSVLVEAMAAAKVVVTRRGSWMASRVGDDSAVRYSDSEQLGPALAEAVDRFEELSRGAKARQAEAIVAGDSLTLARYFMECGDAADFDSRPHALMIGDGDALAIGNCEARLFLDRLAYFAQAFRVQILFICGSAHKDAEHRRRVADALRPYTLEAVSMVDANIVGDSAAAPAFHTREPPAVVYLSRGMGKERLTGFGLDAASAVCEADASSVDMTSALLFSSPIELERAKAHYPGLENIYYAHPFPRVASQLEDLAGPVNGFELVASADPLRADLGVEVRPVVARTSRYARLMGLNSVDILLSCARGEGARRFLTNVFEPYLASRGVSAFVVGDHGAAVDAENVFFIGDVADRNPLYAAAKLVVVAANPEEGAPLELLEALAKGKPVVVAGASPSALGADGLEGYEDARNLGEAIIELLASPERRARAAEVSHAVAEKLHAGAARDGLVTLLQTLGGAPAEAAFIEALPQPAPGGIVEWRPVVVAANRLVRSFIANEPLDGLEELASHPDTALASTARVAEALIERRAAPLLRVDGGLLARVTRRRARGGGAELVRLAKVALGAYLDPPERDGGSVSLAFNRRFPGVIEMRATDDAASDLQPLARGAVFERRRVDGGMIAWDFHGDEDERPDLSTLDLANLAAAKEISVTQALSLRPEARALGRRIFANWVFAAEGLAVVREPERPPWTLAARIRNLAARLFSGRRSPLHRWSPWAKPNPLFDAAWYVSEYPQAAGREGEAFRHYDRYGVSNGLDPSPFFGVDWCFAFRPELRAFRENPLDHYLRCGADDGYDPSPNFSGSRYLEANPDVRKWRLNPLLHYIEWGRREGRDIYPAEPRRPHQSIAAPAIFGGPGVPWIELELDRSFEDQRPPIQLFCGEARLDLVRSERAGKAMVKALLPMREAASGIVHLRVSLNSSQPLFIVALRTGWSLMREMGETG
jgi:glycosyltransferase involved in cell wall biosynthesis